MRLDEPPEPLFEYNGIHLTGYTVNNSDDTEDQDDDDYEPDLWRGNN